MIDMLMQNTFKTLSRVLRKTPLRRIAFVNKLHSTLFGMLSNVKHVKIRNFTLEVDTRDKLMVKKMSLYGCFEEFLGDILISLAKKDSVVIDIGANIGIHSVALAKKVGANGKIISFEPDPDNFSILSRNVDLNNLGNVTLHNLAISSASGEALLYQDANNRGALSLNAKNVADGGENTKPVMVRTVVADEMLVDYAGNITLVKIDVEGAEPFVIKSMEKTIRDNPNLNIIFEYVPNYIRNFDVDPKSFLNDVENMGFKLALINEQTQLISPMDANQILKSVESSSDEFNILAYRGSLSELHLPR